MLQCSDDALYKAKRGHLTKHLIVEQRSDSAIGRCLHTVMGRACGLPVARKPSKLASHHSGSTILRKLFLRISARQWVPPGTQSGIGAVLGDTSEGTSNITSTVRCHLRCCELSVGVSHRSYSGALVAPLGVPMAIPARSDAVPESSAPAFFGEGGEDGALMLQCSDDALGWLWDCVFTSGIYSRG